MNKFTSSSDVKTNQVLVPETKEADTANLQHLIEIGKLVLAELDVERVLTISIDKVIEISCAERGLIILFDKDREILFETARNLKKEEIENPKFEVSRTIINQIRAEGEPVCLRNAYEDPSLKKSQSAARLKILSVICLPLIYQEKIFGVVYLDNRTVTGVFKPETSNFVMAFADFISLAAYHALERKRLYNHIQSLETELRDNYCFEFIIGHHPKMVEILKLVAQVADTDATILIQGESA